MLHLATRHSLLNYGLEHTIFQKIKARWKFHRLYFSSDENTETQLKSIERKRGCLSPWDTACFCAATHLSLFSDDEQIRLAAAQSVSSFMSQQEKLQQHSIIGSKDKLIKPLKEMVQVIIEKYPHEMPNEIIKRLENEDDELLFIVGQNLQDRLQIRNPSIEGDKFHWLEGSKNKKILLSSLKSKISFLRTKMKKNSR